MFSKGKQLLGDVLLILVLVPFSVVTGCGSAKSTHGNATVHQQISTRVSLLNPAVVASVGDKVAEAAIQTTIDYLGGGLPVATKLAAANAGLKAAIEQAENEQKPLNEADRKAIKSNLLDRLRAPHDSP